MRKIFAIIVIIFTAMAVFSYASPHLDVQNDASDKIMYFYHLGRLNDSRDSIEVYYGISSISKDTVDTIFRLPIYRFTKDWGYSLYQRLFDSMLLYDSYSSMTLRKKGKDNSVFLGVEFGNDTTYQSFKGVYLTDVMNKPMIIREVEDSLLTKLGLERSNDSIVMNVHCGRYPYFEDESSELYVYLRFESLNSCNLIGPYNRGWHVLFEERDTTLRKHFKWILEYRK